MNKLTLQLWNEMALNMSPKILLCEQEDNMTELQEKLKQYKDLKKYIQEYNEKELQKALDLGVRILQDLITKYPNKVGITSIEFENDYSKEEIILKIKEPFNPNGGFFEANKGAKDYVLERYPDAKKHYLGIEVGKLISKRNIDDFLNEYEED